MSNFDYLKAIPELHNLYEYCYNADVYQKSDQKTSAINSRMALEWIVKNFYTLNNIEIGERTSLYTLLEGEPFTTFIDNDRIMMAAHYIRKVGNIAAHLGTINAKQAFFCVLNIHTVVSTILQKLHIIKDFPAFKNELLTPTTIEDITEAQTRKLFIDMMLNEAGWEVLTRNGAIVPSKACIEIEIDGMPNNSGVGYADYVLFGANGKPLAVIEAKRTSVDIIKGKHQAELYAEGLERQYGVKPIIYYSNGYTTAVIDGLDYPPRNIFGFHTQQELELLIQRRVRMPISQNLNINNNITDREYQKRAISQVCERFNNKQRRTLLIMATGTGKTRVSISLTDVLTRNNWVKNILFLADRTALVKQAAKNYAKLLPGFSTSILSEEKEPDMSARILFSTYQTMINYIDKDTKDFSIGRFDLIIIDEAHRSVFGRFSSILNYFDGLLVGLTATPREEVDKNTFELFYTEAEDAFAYELDEAVADGFLVPYYAFKKGSSILKEGIKYDNLSNEEKEQMEAVWKYEKAKLGLNPNSDYSRDIEKSEVFKYIFNKGTIDLVLQDLMKNGQKVDGGDKIGKTIIFAYNHSHAELIVKRFYYLYPEYGSNYCVLIDNYVNYAQNLIDRFEQRNQLPQIAVSVDMLDTGIDVVDILNLVFFKPVHSKIKFNQMIGRGTRLSKNIFGYGLDKDCFYIFDWCNNFEYFSINPNAKETSATMSISEKLFRIKTDLVYSLQSAEYQQDTFTCGLYNEVKTELIDTINNLNDKRIAVRENWQLVDKYKKSENWNYISAVDAVQIKDSIAPLVINNQDGLSAKRFDLLLFSMEVSLIDNKKTSNQSQKKLILICQKLEKKATMPQVIAKLPIIKEVLSVNFWENISIDNLDRVRKELRDIVTIIDNDDRHSFTVDIEDYFIDGGEAEFFMPITYKQRVLEYLAKNKNLTVIQKIINIEQLSYEDIDELERILWKELGTKKDYIKCVNDFKMICGDSVAAFIRAQVGVDRKIAMEKFSQFLSNVELDFVQQDYLKTIISYVCQNGDITPNTIVNVAPFDSFDWVKSFGQYTNVVRDYVNTLHNVISLSTNSVSLR